MRRWKRPVTYGLSVLLVLVVAAVAPALDRLYGADVQPVVELRRFYRVAGRPFPTASFPVSKAWLYEAAVDLRGYAERRRIAAYIEELGYAPEEVRTSVELDFRPQAYLETEYLRGGILEKLRREDPALSVGVAGAVDDGPLLYTRVEAIRDYRIDHPSNLIPPQEDDPLPYEFNNVYAGYLYWPFEFAAITFGRQKLDLGPAPRSSIALSPQLPYLDALRLELDLGPIRMHHLVSSIDNFEADRDVALPAAADAASDSDGDSGATDDRATVYGFDRTQIFFNTHYFEYRFPAWRLGVGANLVVARELNNYNLSDFFPVFSWHNANILPRNMSAFLDASVPVGGGFEVYGQLSFDDIRTTGVGIGDTPIPTIPAATLGGRYSRLGPRLTWDAAVDLGYTHYLWGNYPLEEGLSRAVYRLRAEGDGYAFPLTSPYGPGSLFGIASLRVIADRATFGFFYEAVGAKPDANLFTTPQAESDELASQAYLVTHRVELEAAYALLDWVSVSATPGIHVDDGEVALYLDLGGVIRYGASRTVAELDRRR